MPSGMSADEFIERWSVHVPEHMTGSMVDDLEDVLIADRYEQGVGSPWDDALRASVDPGIRQRGQALRLAVLAARLAVESRSDKAATTTWATVKDLAEWIQAGAAIVFEGYDEDDDDGFEP